MQGIDESILLDLIGCIYDCVIAPERWEQTVGRIKQTFRWHNAFLAANSLIGGGPIVHVALGVPQPYLGIASDPSYSASILELWGGPSKIAAAPLEEPVVQTEMGDPTTWSTNKYFIDFVHPQGVIDAVAIGLARDPTMIANLAGGRHRSDGPIRDDELAGLRVLAPHLRRAVTIANLFDDMSASNAMFMAAMETSRAGIVLIDNGMKIIHANSKAHSMLTEGDPIIETNGFLSLRHEFTPAALSHTVATAASSYQGGRAAGLPTRRRDGSPLLLHVLPLQGGKVRSGIVMRATTAVFVAPAPEALILPVEALGRLFDLTPAEARVMELAAGGITMVDAAARLGIAPSTVKTHLMRIYEKTGTHKRAELATLVRNATLPW